MNNFLIKVVIGAVLTGLIGSPVYASGLEKDFSEAYKRIVPAVVYVITEKIITIKKEGKEYKQKQKGIGSGIIISPDGYILTLKSVIGMLDNIKVELFDGRRYKAKVIGKDAKTDIAVLKIKAEERLPVAKLGDSDGLKITEWVMAVGNSYGLSSTVTVGIISALHRSGFGMCQYEDFIQTDISISPGFAGGPLTNLKGKVIGINAFIISFPGGDNVSFAIPINTAKEIFDQLKERGKVTHGWLGIVIQPLTEDLIKFFGLSSTEGVLVGKVLPESPAEKYGLKIGDVIIELNGKRISNVELQREVDRIKPGTYISLKAIRDKNPISLRIKVSEMPDEKE